MVDFPSNPQEGDRHVEGNNFWTFIQGAWVVGQGIGSKQTTQIVDEGAEYQIVGGKLIQWGEVATGSGDPANFPVVYHIPYDVKPKFVAIPLSNTADERNVHIRTIGANQAQIATRTGAINVGMNVHWIAIGDAPAGMEMPTEVDDYNSGGGGAVETDIIDDGDGYYIAGNTLIQWGDFVAATSVSVTFGIEFAAPPRMALNSSNASLSNGPRMGLASSITTTGCVVNGIGSNGATNVSGTWVAIGEAPDDRKMPTKIIGSDGADYLSKIETDPQQVESPTEFKSITTVHNRLQIVQDRSVPTSNDTGIVIYDGDLANRGYLFWREDVERLQYNVYDENSTFLRSAFYVNEGDSYFNVSSGVLRVRSEAGSVVDNPFLQFYKDNNVMVQQWNVGHGNGDHRCTINLNSTAGVYQSQVLFDHLGVEGFSRVTAGEFYANGSGPGRVSKFWGSDAGFAAFLQNRVGGEVHFGDLGFVQLAAGGGGPTGVYLGVNNSGNVSSWGIHTDFASDPATKDAVQPSMVDAVKHIGELLPIRWVYNELAPRLRKVKTNYHEVDHPHDLKVEDLGVADDSEHAVELGFSSEDIKRIAPGAVYEVDGIERIDYRQVVPHCLRAIQQLTERIEALENSSS